MNRVLPPPPPPSLQPLPQNAVETQFWPEKKHEKEYDSDDSLSGLFAKEGDSDYDSDDDVDPDLLDRYYQQMKETDGFDITDFPPGRCWYTSIFPMTHYLDDPESAAELKDYAGKALKYYNDKKGTNYVVKDVLKVNGDGCRDFIYYITFSVKNGEAEFFQAKVVEDLKDNLAFPIVRPKGKAAVG